MLRGLGAAASLILSPADIYQLALSAGFPSDTAVKMTAIALKESGGNPAAFNGVAPDESYGLWQINMLGNLGTRRMALFSLTAKSQLFDPSTNARAAYLTWGGDDANLDRAWYISSADAARYQQFLPVAMAAAGVDSLAPPAPDQVAGIDVPAAAASYLANLQSFDPVTVGATVVAGLGLWLFFGRD